MDAAQSSRRVLVSIPLRQAKNSRVKEEITNLQKFQFLLGRLKTIDKKDICSCK